VSSHWSPLQQTPPRLPFTLLSPACFLPTE
jgi:hypothetical protein